MFDLTILIPYTLACVLFSLVPGPSVTLVLANALSGGGRAGAMTILGTNISMLSMVVVLAFGLEFVVQFVGEAFYWIKLVGAVYLVWIGWQMFNTTAGLQVPAEQTNKSSRRYIVQGAMVNWGNPKTLLFLGAFLPQFVAADQPAFAQIMVLGVIVMTIATITDCAYAFLAVSARHFFSSAHITILNRIAGLILMAGGFWLALQKRA